ncbi:MAG: arginine deiminase family protein [Pseudomonadota bacterium]
MEGKIRAEWDPLKKVVIHRPGIEMFLGLMEPYGSLYERAFSRDEARREHEVLEHTLKHEFKVEVLRLKETIVQAAEKKPEVRESLVKQAHDAILYKGGKHEIEMARKEFVENAKYLDDQHFFYLMLMSPIIDLKAEKGTRNIQLNITEREPLANLYFMRDQQFVTNKGIVLCRMAKPARRREPEITKFLWKEVLHLPIAHEMWEPATIEGGEFIPMGKFALVGIGDRTNRDAIDQLLSIGLDVEELGVVHQAKHPLIPGDKPDPMVNMHLDTYFNVASSKVVVASEMLIKEAKVEIYHNEGNGNFAKDAKETNLHDYIKSKGFEIINITTLEQLSYASNFLCIKDGHILAIEVERNVKDVLANLERAASSDAKRYGKLYEQSKRDYEYLRNEGQFFPHKKELNQLGIDAYPVVLTNLTGGYGGAHCMTCALDRG